MKINTGQPILEPTEDVIKAFRDLLAMNKAQRTTVVIETGTYLGTGTTMAFIEAHEEFKLEPRTDSSIRLYTIEVNEVNYKQAVENLKPYKWVEVIHGSSVGFDDALEFIKMDEAIIEHEQFPDIFIDSTDNPYEFYRAEIEGLLAEYGIGESIGEDNVLEKLILKHKSKRPLFILDSAGGIGFLEFQKIVEGMSSYYRYYVFARGKEHLKHFRTYAYISNTKPWEILSEGSDWFVALHKGSPFEKKKK